MVLSGFFDFTREKQDLIYLPSEDDAYEVQLM
jgi:hypothetical protein